MILINPKRDLNKKIMINDKCAFLKDEKIRLVPKIGNLHFYNEVDIFLTEELQERQSKISQSFECIGQYELFMHQKRRRKLHDIYACFQPFNEATKALYPFFNSLKKKVNKNDIILNLWDRTGWLTHLLSGLFPEQTIVTTWEGNKDVLGYKGFNYWMQNAHNVKILFCSLNEPLPLKDKSVVFSVGLDTLHRVNQGVFLEELTRVVKDDGAIIFPHVHLSNSEPEPYFDRGGKIIHGNDYEKAFNYLSLKTDWKGYIFSEPYLFSENDILNSSLIPLNSTPDTSDYNALVAILSKFWTNENLSAFSMRNVDSIGTARVLVNLLLNINLNKQKVFLDYTHLNAAVGHLLERHPVYVERIKKLDDYCLSDLATKIIYLAKLCYSVDEISQKLNRNLTEVLSELEELEKLGLLQVLPVSYDGMRLQYYLMSQEFQVSNTKQNLKDLWHSSVKNFSNKIALVSLQDQSEFTFEDCNEIIDNIILALHNNGIRKGDRIISCCNINTESILLFWACMQVGIIFIPISHSLAKKNASYILNLTEAKLLFTQQSYYEELYELLPDFHCIVFDEEEHTSDGLYFSDWLENTSSESEFVPEEVILENDEAVILFTSGSTGFPKGVQLSHGNLYRSGQLIVENFNWTAEDRFFAIGGLDTMSGLRNAAISALNVGASVVIPSDKSIGNLFSLTEEIYESESTILGSNPSFLRLLLKHSQKIGNQISALKTVMCTGNQLSDDLIKDFKDTFKLPIFNYYGLTETTGICISENVTDKNSNEVSVGKTVGCIAQIVDENGIIVSNGEIGELRIFSENLTKGYLKEPQLTINAIKEGWFYTQDLARFNENGTIQLVGRKQEYIKNASEEIVYFREIQKALMESGLFADVGLTDYVEDDFEKIAAFVVLKIDDVSNYPSIKHKIRTLLLEKLGSQSVPHQIHILSELPYSDNGKILKNQLINEYL